MDGDYSAGSPAASFMVGHAMAVDGGILVSKMAVLSRLTALAKSTRSGCLAHQSLKQVPTAGLCMLQSDHVQNQ
jgi:hypothetical protein